MRLHAGLSDDPVLWPAIVREVADQPMAVDAGEDADGDAPHHEAPAARPEEQDRDRKLLRHPGGFEEAVKGISSGAAQVEFGRMIEFEAAMELPPCVVQHPGAVAEIGMAVRIALRPVTKVMGPDDPMGAAHPDRGAEPHKDVFEP